MLLYYFNDYLPFRSNPLLKIRVEVEIEPKVIDLRARDCSLSGRPYTWFDFLMIFFTCT